MTRKIIIAADEEIVCPKCSHHFPLGDGITRQTIERYESEFVDAFVIPPYLATARSRG